MEKQKVSMNKRKFRIGELAKELKVKKFVIRFWEKEFGLQSDRSSGGQRFYTQEDFEKFFMIKELLYKKGFTISGAKKQIETKATSINPAQKTETEPQIIEKIVEKKIEKIPQDFLKHLQNFKSQLINFKNKLEEI